MKASHCNLDACGGRSCVRRQINPQQGEQSCQAFDVSFLKYVNIFDQAYVNKDIDVRSYVDGYSAIAYATADALCPNTHTETLTQTTAVQLGSSSVSESLSATDCYHWFQWH